jgi:hypothetical protein
MGRPKKRRRKPASGRVATGESSTGAGEVGRVEADAVASVGSTEKLELATGVLQQMSDVRIDPAALAAEADQIASEFPAATTAGEMQQQGGEVAPQGPSPAEVEEGYKLISYAVVERGAEIFAPAWGITHDENSRVSTGIARALVLWFPDQPIPPKYLALLVIAGTVAEIVNARKDPTTGKLKPRFHAKQSKDSAAGSAAAA